MHQMFKFASAKSLWRGVDYYKKRKVINFTKICEVSMTGEPVKEGARGRAGESAGILYSGLVRGRSPSQEKSIYGDNFNLAYNDGYEDDYNYDGSPSAPILSPKEAEKYNAPDAPVYHVTINTVRPKKSTCDCKFAKGRYVICKHMIALFLEAEPEQLDKLYKEIEDNQRAEEERQHEEKNSRRRELEIRAHSMSRAELEDEYVKLSIRLDESWEELQEAYRARWHH